MMNPFRTLQNKWYEKERRHKAFAWYVLSCLWALVFLVLFIHSLLISLHALFMAVEIEGYDYTGDSYWCALWLTFTSATLYWSYERMQDCEYRYLLTMRL